MHLKEAFLQEAAIILTSGLVKNLTKWTVEGGKLEAILKKPVGHLWLCVQHVPVKWTVDSKCNAMHHITTLHATAAASPSFKSVLTATLLDYQV